ncbi:uncharacterized protein Dana_GF10377 [Drosophila ananassae]|uniref:Protein commissureless n=1 Tax=Drosophila ananassae TaxID=7217 RepID=B3M9W7_DROAN|nr:protein commissureless 2 [Drosophila ananassae]EDV40158.1 uncharacterized protein Dana_GF10377 [Drosophila ananassae]
MEGLPRALNYELSHDLHFDQYAAGEVAQQILNSGKSSPPAEASTPTISLANSEFLKQIGAQILSSIQLKHRLQLPKNSSEEAMDFDLTHRVVLDSSSVDQQQQQLEYDKFMNEVWIGIVFTLILISMVFCICSCFLYHQFRTWKRNYRNNATNSTQCTIVDIEALKLHPETEDPVPEYTLVSGLPSYEAALELLQKTPQSQCLIVYPSVFSVFNRQERGNLDLPAGQQAAVESAAVPQSPLLCEATMPLLPATAATSTVTTATPTTAAATTGTATATVQTPTCEAIKPSYVMMPIVPSYSEVFGSTYKTVDEKKKSKSKDSQVKDDVKR